MNQDIRIDRLSLRVPGLDEDAARDLARLVAEGLAADLPTSDNPISHYPVSDSRNSDSRASDSRGSDNRGSDSRNSGSLSIRVAADDIDPYALAWRIAGEIRRAMGREVKP
jgi:hypothetical protein